VTRPPRGNTLLVLAIRRRDPSALMAKIALGLGISRERVRQILTKEFLATQVACFRPDQRSHCCLRCGQAMSRLGSYHKSAEVVGWCVICVRESKLVELMCTGCGAPFLRAVRLVAQAVSRGAQLVFHSKSCQGSYTARRYGFLAHPENIHAGRSDSRRSASTGRFLPVKARAVWHRRRSATGRFLPATGGP